MPPTSPQLGLVCITQSDEVRFRTMTRTRYRQLGASADEALRGVYEHNVLRLDHALTFCRGRGIRLYRLSSALFPFADEPYGHRILLTFADRLAAVGRRAREEGIRLVLHPDQFVVLNSDTESVILNSIRILETHAFVFDLLDQPRTAWATFTIHGGKSGRAERLVETLGRLPEAVAGRLALENDERAYGAAEILDVCRRAGVPMVFDAHHHLVHDKLESYEDPSIAALLAEARETWPDPAWQLVHISNGREALCDARHHDLIQVMPSAYRQAPWIEVEAKHKELAIAGLQRDWLPGL